MQKRGTISYKEMLIGLQAESVQWKKELQNHHVTGIIYGIKIAITLLERIHQKGQFLRINPINWTEQTDRDALIKTKPYPTQH